VDRELYRRVGEIFDAALAHAPDAPQDYARVACRDDPALLAQVIQLLDDYQDAEQRKFLTDTVQLTVGAGQAPPAALALQAPGVIIAGRYRVVALLGGGGEGEVYLTDDLTLGVRRALKLFPPHARCTSDELTLSQRVEHENVCRVFDLGDHEGRCYWVMDYASGGSLRKLLDQVGRLSERRAVEFGRQVCHGLHAIHNASVIHRDLKPANILLDGASRVKITDFGIAIDAAEQTPRQAMTLQYTAPEVLAGQRPTKRSDLYSLGVVLYELFTGGRFERNDPQSEEIPIPADVHPDIQRLLRDCLATSPAKRPQSALEVAARLALAQGRTLTREETEELRENAPSMSTAAVWSCAVLTVVGALLTPLLHSRTTLVGATQPQHSEVLRAEAVRLAQFVAPSSILQDEAFGFVYERRTMSAIAAGNEPPGDFAEAGLSPVVFWYRRSEAQPLTPGRLLAEGLHSLQPQRSMVTLDDPPERSGSLTLILDARQGRMLGLRYLPLTPVLGELEAKAELGHALHRSEQIPQLGEQRLRQLAPDLFFASRWEFLANERSRWTGPSTASGVWRVRLSDSGKSAIVQAAWIGEQIVYFDVAPDPGIPNTATNALNIAELVGSGLFVAMLGIGSWFAVQNFRRGRVDLKGASYLAVFVFGAWMLVWLLEAKHRASLDEIHVLTLGISWALFEAAQLFLAHLALDPYLRRLWPDTLVSWSRMFSGRFRDPLIGRHVLIGCFCGMLLMLIDQGGALLGAVMETPTNHAIDLGLWGRIDVMLNALLAPRHALAQTLVPVLSAIRIVWVYALLSIFLPKLVLKSDWWTGAAFAVFYTLVLVGDTNADLHDWVVRLPLVFPKVAVTAYLLIREGVLATVVMISARLLLALPLSLLPAHFDITASVLLVIIGLVIFAALTALKRSESRNEPTAVANAP
jgi:serine/threonine-protein kinase